MPTWYRKASNKGFSGFTADQWRIWTTVYSAIALKGIIPKEHLCCWLLYVRACTLLFSRIISESNVATADEYLVTFCKKFEMLYGQERCTVNMHLHAHLKDCLLDYGSAHGFWTFPFERFNGISGAYHTNNKAVESQIMKKVLCEQAIVRLDLPTECSADFLPLYQKISSKSKGSMQETAKVESIMDLRRMSDFTTTDFSAKNSFAQVIPPVQKRVLSLEHQGKLKSKCILITVNFFPVIYEECRRVTIGDEIVTSIRYKDDHQAVIVAYWPSTGSTLNNIDYVSCNVGLIQHFVKHSIVFANEDDSESTEDHLFCGSNIIPTEIGLVSQQYCQVLWMKSIAFAATCQFKELCIGVLVVLLPLTLVSCQNLCLLLYH